MPNARRYWIPPSLAKAVELDERIPFISKLRRYTYLPYATVDFRRCECQVIRQLNWNLQCTTLYDWAESALSLGIVFEQDEVAPAQENVLREKNLNVAQQQKRYVDPVTVATSSRSTWTRCSSRALRGSRSRRRCRSSC